MPSKKPTKQEVKQELKGLIEQYGIKFEGPVPPHKWPRKQKHLFQVIRDIWANRYDEYKKRTGGDETILLNHLKRVRNLRNNAYRLRAGININEGTWRGVVETLVFGRFDEEIVWLVSLMDHVVGLS